MKFAPPNSFRVVHRLLGLTATLIIAAAAANVQAVTYDVTAAPADPCNPYSSDGSFAGHVLFMQGINPNIYTTTAPFTDGYHFSVFSDTDPGVFIENADGTATLSGTILSTQVSGYGFRIDLHFSGLTNNPGPMGPNLELMCKCYVPPFDLLAGSGTCADPGSHGAVDPTTWHYYTSWDSATLYGTGIYDGAVLHLTPFMHNFQVGVGASGKNANAGASGWFTWTVVQQPTNGPTLRSSEQAGGAYSDINFNFSPHRPQPGEIGDTVYCDLNGNGVQDNNESGIQGVKVDLFSQCTGSPVDSEVTDQDGHYLFTDLQPGQYCVVVDQSTVPMQCSVPVCATSFTVNLAEGQSFLDADFCFKPPCPPCVSPALNLGAAGSCTVLQLGNGNVSITGPAGGILGDVCVGPNGSFSMSGDEYITGTVNLGPGAKFSNSSHGTVNVMNGANLTPQINAANSAASFWAGQPATQTFTTLDGKNPTTITGVVGNNVIKVKDISLSGKQITLTGPAGAKFIINVTGKFALTGGGAGPQIRAGGAVQPSDILFNVIGIGSDVAFSGGGGGTGCCAAIVDGTLLAPQRKIALSPGLVNGEIISGKDISIVSGSSVRCPICK